MGSYFFRGIIAAGFMLISAALMTGCASINTFVVLLPEEGGAPTAVTVGEGNRAAILDKPFSAAKVDTKGNIEKTTVTQEDVNRSFGAALAAQPPKAVSFTLDAVSKRMAWIPPGFAHGFLVLSEHAEFMYKTTDYYAPEHERTLLWNDPALGIGWPLQGEPLLADKDLRGTPWHSAEKFA